MTTFIRYDTDASANSAELARFGAEAIRQVRKQMAQQAEIDTCGRCGTCHAPLAECRECGSLSTELHASGCEVGEGWRRAETGGEFGDECLACASTRRTA